MMLKIARILGTEFECFGLLAQALPSRAQGSGVKLWDERELRVFVLRLTWAPKVCEIMAFMAILLGLGLLFYILLGV